MKGTNDELTADQLDLVTGGKSILKKRPDLIEEELKTEKSKLGGWIKKRESPGDW